MVADANPVVVGIDIGTLDTKVTLGPAYDNELVRNSQGGHVTPTSITFGGANDPRMIGEDAHDPNVADMNTVGMLDRLLVDSLKEDDEDIIEGSSDGEMKDSMSPFRRFLYDKDGNDKRGIVTVPAVDGIYSSTSLLAAFLGKIKSHALATVIRIDRHADKEYMGNDVDNMHFVFAVPDSYPTSTRHELLDACHAAGIASGSVLNASQCISAAYERKFGKDETITQERIVVIAEVGHIRSRITVLRHVPKIDDQPPIVNVLSSVSSSNLGAFVVDVALYDHFIATHPSLKGESFPRDSRRSQRLLAGCSKLKHILSMLPDGKVTVENVGINETDVDLSCTRELLEQMCFKSVRVPLTTLVDKAIEKAGKVPSDVDVVEVAGGGSRVPMIRDAICAACDKGEEYIPSRSFDDSSLAFGASLIGIVTAEAVEEEEDEGRAARRLKLRVEEQTMLERDKQMIRRADSRNKIEARVLELRSAITSRNGDVLPKTGGFVKFLDDTDEWLYSEKCDEATVEEIEAKWTDVRLTTELMCADYFAAEKKREMQKEREMEEEAKQAAAERGAEGDGDDQEDHDTRRLNFPRRLEIVMKNKKEANELFSDGNYKHAAARYAKALSHCSKFFDLSPAQEEELRDVKLSLYLNLALAYIKLEKLDNAMQSCDDALKLDSKNTKALYRRASVFYQKRKFDDAMRDLVKAEKESPGNKDVKKLRGLVDQQLIKQKNKEKAMAQKMFG
jgi:molecular chaperone DnaK (HSP70)